MFTGFSNIKLFTKIKGVIRAIFHLIFRIAVGKTASKPIYGVNCRKRLISFTFDSKGSEATTVKILDVLARYNVKSTFFLTGEYVKNL